MRTTAVLLTLVMLTSALAGCAGSGDDTEKDEQIASLELEVANLTSENAENAENVAALQSTLEEAQAALELANEDLANISAQLSTAEWHRANLSNSLSDVMDQLNQTENDELITSLQAETICHDLISYTPMLRYFLTFLHTLLDLSFLIHSSR